MSGCGRSLQTDQSRTCDVVLSAASAGGEGVTYEWDTAHLVAIAALPALIKKLIQIRSLLVAV